MYRHVFGALIVAVLLQGGCNCSDQRPGEQPWDLGVRPDGLAGIRLDVPDDEPPDFGFPPDVTECEEGFSFAVARFDLPFRARRVPQVSDSTVFTLAPADSSSGHERRLAWVEPETGALNDRISLSGRNYLVDVDENGAFALHSTDPETIALRPHLLRPNGGGFGPGSSVGRWQAPPVNIGGGRGRQLDRKNRRFAAVLENDPMEAPGWVGYYDGEEGHEVHIKDWAEPPVTLTPNGFALVGRTGPLSGGGNLEIYTYDPKDGVRRRTKTEAYERDPISSGNTLYWNTDEAVYRTRVTDFDPEAIHRGMCGPVDVHGGGAVFSCETNSPSGGGHRRPVFGRNLYLYDGTRVTPLPTDGGLVYSPKIWGDNVVWVEYDSRDAVTRGPNETGTVYFWSTGQSKAIEVAPIGSPCFTCNSIFADVNLSIGNGLIAWNYASPNRSDGHTATDNGAVARFRHGCR